MLLCCESEAHLAESLHSSAFVMLQRMDTSLTSGRLSPSFIESKAILNLTNTIQVQETVVYKEFMSQSDYH